MHFIFVTLIDFLEFMTLFTNIYGAHGCQRITISINAQMILYSMPGTSTMDV